MQLRVARLCLDCEELHAEKRCPRCASGSYAFLTNWLPCDERRRFRRDRRPATAAGWGVAVVVQAVMRWFRGDFNDRPLPATRRDDVVAQQTFEAIDASTPRAAEAQFSSREQPGQPR